MGRAARHRPDGDADDATSYLEIKAAHPDAILFFRLGDFYEMFLDDAVRGVAHPRHHPDLAQQGAADEVPLCGIPYHSCQPYIAKLVQHGHQVAICEQVEDPKAAKGIVAPRGGAGDHAGAGGRYRHPRSAPQQLPGRLSPGSDGRWGLACVDITTGEFRATESGALTELVTELAAPRSRRSPDPRRRGRPALPSQLARRPARARGQPAFPPGSTAEDRARHELLGAFPGGSLEAFGCQGLPGAAGAAGAVLHYLAETQKGRLPHLTAAAHLPDPRRSWCWTTSPGATWS
ncbi:MAG: hypothetical protein M0C28_37065 [Candidatus Moduliflexus flocculans]|nr:hypothetical protein [Candidatus Moduliflexus flocculans]